MLALPGAAVECPLCGESVTLPSSARAEADGGMVTAVVITDRGTFLSHLRDKHPERFAELAELRRDVNANPFIGGMPRKAGGSFMFTGEDVTGI